MSTTHKEVLSVVDTLKLALEVLEICYKDCYIPVRLTREAIIAVKEALSTKCVAQPANYKQEPVAVVETIGGYPDESAHVAKWLVPYKSLKAGDKLYTTPYVATPRPQRTAAEGEDTRRAWVGLSREDCYQVRERESDAFMYGVAWAEAKLKEKNT